VLSNGYIANKVDYAENISVSAADNSWDLEDSLDDTEECDDDDDKDIMPTLDPDEDLEEDVPAKHPS
jgi:hypothetical protein